MQKQENKKPLAHIFLFPLSKTGIAQIAMFTFFLALLFLVRSTLINVLGPIAIIILRGLYVINLIIGAQVLYYLVSCVRESADGATRAPDGLFSGFDADELRDIIQDFLTTIAPYIFCFCPAFIYLAATTKMDWIYFSLLATGIFYFPMFLLAIVLFNSSSGFNPLVHIVSIFSAFIPYCILIFQFFLIAVVFQCLGLLFGDSWVSYLVSIPCTLYFTMMLMHLLGRFYYSHQDKLNWEV